MQPLDEDRFVLFLRADRTSSEPVEERERPVDGFPTYEEARQVRQRYQQAGKDCVIRYVGPAGGGD
jgi:hypothetical protein